MDIDNRDVFTAASHKMLMPIQTLKIIKTEDQHTVTTGLILSFVISHKMQAVTSLYTNFYKLPFFFAEPHTNQVHSVPRNIDKI